MHCIEVEGVSFNKFIEYLKTIRQDINMSDDLNMFLVHLGMFNQHNSGLTKFEVLTEQTNYILSKLDFEWLIINNKTLDLMAKHMMDTGFLPKRQENLV